MKMLINRKRWLRIVSVVLAVVMMASIFLFALSFRVAINTSEGLVSISLGTSVLADTSTRSPTVNIGVAWTNPDRAYDDNGAGYAQITAGSPSGSNVWGTYGFTFTTETITTVKVRYDAWSVGSVQSVTRQATGDGSNTGGFTTSPLWSKINDSNDATYIVGVTQAGGRATFTFTAFTVPVGSIIQSVDIHYRHRSTTTSNAYAHGAAIKVNGTYYSMKDTVGWDTGHTTGVASGSPIEDHIYIGTTNPSTGSSWNVTAVNALTEFGVGSTDFNPDARFYQVDITVNYTEYDDQIKVDVSWDNGGTWSSTQDTTLTSTEVTTWYDVTGATTWNATKLNDTNFKVRALAQSVNNAEVVRLDWLPVEVVYSSEPVITVNPTSYDFGTVAESSTPSTITTYFTIDNTSTMQTDQTISVTTTTWSGGVAWNHNDSGSPEANAAALLANRGGVWGSGDVVVKNASPNFIYENCPVTTDYSFGLKLLAPTTFNDGVQKQIVVRVTAVSG